MDVDDPTYPLTSRGLLSQARVLSKQRRVLDVVDGIEVMHTSEEELSLWFLTTTQSDATIWLQTCERTEAEWRALSEERRRAEVAKARVGTRLIIGRDGNIGLRILDADGFDRRATDSEVATVASTRRDGVAFALVADRAAERWGLTSDEVFARLRAAVAKAKGTEKPPSEVAVDVATRTDAQLDAMLAEGRALTSARASTLEVEGLPYLVLLSDTVVFLAVDAFPWLRTVTGEEKRDRVADAVRGRLRGLLLTRASRGSAIYAVWDGARGACVHPDADDPWHRVFTADAGKSNRARWLLKHLVDVAGDAWGKGWDRPPGDLAADKARRLPPAVVSYFEVSDGITGHRANDVGVRVLGAALARARVFQFDADVAEKLQRNADEFVLDVAFGWKRDKLRLEEITKPGPCFAHLLAPARLLEKRTPADMVATCRRVAEDIPFPEPLPFQTVFFGWDRPITLGGFAISARHINPDRLDPALLSTEPESVGVLIDRSGLVAEFIHFREKDGNLVADVPVIHRFGSTFPVDSDDPEDPERWIHPFSLMPWVATALVGIVADCRAFVIETGRDDARYRKSSGAVAKRLNLPKHAPGPWYSVNLRDEVVIRRMARRGAHANVALNEDGERVVVGRHWSHRWDVRGHERVRIHRGQAPMSAEDRAWFSQRGYRLYEGASAAPEDEDVRRMRERGHLPKRPDEWLAVKHAWIDEQVRGPEDKPYVPAARKVTVDLRDV